MKYTKTVSFLAMVITTLVVMSSCEDEVSSTDLLAYIQVPKTTIYTLQCTYSADGTIVNSSATGESSVKVGVVAGLSRQTSKDVHVQIILDPSLVEAYNAANKTSFVAINSDAVSFEGGGSIMIPSGQTICSDSVVLDFSKLSVEGIGSVETSYLVPIRLESMSSKDKGIIVSKNTNVAYVQIKTSKLSNIDRTADIPTGNPIDRKNWAVTAGGSLTGYDEDGMLDGDNTTIWRCNKYGVITINMGSAKAVKAFRLLTAKGSFYTSAPKNISVEGSSDGANWEMFGLSPELARSLSSTVDAKTNYIKMIYAKPYKYYKLTINNHWISTGSCIAELNAIE